SLWWAARLSDEWGPFFARGIVFTGLLTGAGLFGQIVLSLFNMYGPKGKAVMGALFVLGGVIASLLVVYKIEPALKEKARLAELKAKPDDKQPDGGKKVEPPDNGKQPPITPETGASVLDTVLMWPVKENDKELAVKELPFKKANGGMVRAFFDKD